MFNNSRQLSVSDPITVDDDAIRKLFVDLVVLAESITHPDFQVVRKLLSCGLEHHLAVVPVGREGGREGGRREGRGGERRGEEGRGGERRGEEGRGGERRGEEGRGGERRGEEGRGGERRGEEGREGSDGGERRGEEGGRGEMERGKREEKGYCVVTKHCTPQVLDLLRTLTDPTLSWWGWYWQ